MVPALLRSVSALSLLLAASACQPQGDQDTDETPVAEDPVTDDTTADVDATPSTDPVSEPEPVPVPEPDPEPVELALNDVSILLPPPLSTDDPVLAITDLGFDGSSVWPDELFQQFLGIANGNFGAVAAEDVANNSRGSSIDISAFADKSVWHVASVRIDPGAPGLSKEIAEVFGQQPQIRLVLQPVTDGVVVHDVAAHIIYSYIADAEKIDDCALRRFEPDQARFRQIVDDAVEIKSKLAAGEIGGEAIMTDGPLGIHPAADPDRASMVTRTAFRDALQAFLETHLDPSKINAMAIMGLPGGRDPEPWIFLAMARGQTGQVSPIPSPAIPQEGKIRFAQMLDARPRAPGNPTVSPAVRANNLTPITCAFEVPVDPRQPGGPKPPANPIGVSTAELFPDGDAARMREIVDVIADPTKAHFFNTDCVSCHTETRREMDILGTNEVDAPVDPAVLPTELWNVRNFGWFPPFPSGTPLATVTRRTATESEEVVEAINDDLRTR